MSAIQRTLTTVRVRLFYQQCLRNLGWAALAALIVAAALLVTGRLLGTNLPVWLHAAGLVVALAAALASAGLRFPSTTHAAAAVDERFKLKDRLATSLYARKLPADPFAALVLEDAEQTAGNLALRAAFPIQLTRVWGYVLPLGMLLGGLWLWLPNDLLGRQLARQQQARAAERQTAVATAAQERIVQVVAAIRNPQPGQKPVELDPETAQALDHLVEMTRREMTDPQAARTAAGKLACSPRCHGKTGPEQGTGASAAAQPTEQDAVERIGSG